MNTATVSSLVAVRRSKIGKGFQITRTVVGAFNGDASKLATQTKPDGVGRWFEIEPLPIFADADAFIAAEKEIELAKAKQDAISKLTPEQIELLGLTDLVKSATATIASEKTDADLVQVIEGE